MNKFFIFLGCLALFVIVLMLFAFPFMWIWNFAVVAAIPAKPIAYSHAVCLMIFYSLFFVGVKHDR